MANPSRASSSWRVAAGICSLAGAAVSRTSAPLRRGICLGARADSPSVRAGQQAQNRSLGRAIRGKSYRCPRVHDTAGRPRAGPAKPAAAFLRRPLLSVEDLEDLTRARVLIETMALRESINDDDLAWESNVLSAHHAPGNLDSTREATLTAKGRKRPKPSTTPCYRVPTADDLKSIATELGDCWQLHRHWSGELAHDKDRCRRGTPRDC